MVVFDSVRDLDSSNLFSRLFGSTCSSPRQRPIDVMVKYLHSPLRRQRSQCVLHRHRICSSTSRRKPSCCLRPSIFNSDYFNVHLRQSAAIVPQADQRTCTIIHRMSCVVVCRTADSYDSNMPDELDKNKLDHIWPLCQSVLLSCLQWFVNVKVKNSLHTSSWGWAEIDHFVDSRLLIVWLKCVCMASTSLLRELVCHVGLQLFYCVVTKHLWQLCPVFAALQSNCS